VVHRANSQSNLSPLKPKGDKVDSARGKSRSRWIPRSDSNFKILDSICHLHFESHKKAFVFPLHCRQFSSSELSSQSTIPSHLSKKELNYIYSKMNYFDNTDVNRLVEHISFPKDNKHVYCFDIFLYYNRFHPNHQYNLKHHLIK
jgi:hypothetical protein